jgi:3-deoxy-7-phosphoheptulonate synthase
LVVVQPEVDAGTARAPTPWSPDSWRRLPIEQSPEWPDEIALKGALAELERLPPLIDPGEARRLLAALGEVSERRAIVLQAGDCAESFAEVTFESIRKRLSVILQMAVVLAYGSGLPVVRVGRIAGQFAKPRSSPTERVGDAELPSFRGHMVNDDAPELPARTPDPARMVAAYHHAAATLNVLRTLTAQGFASLPNVHVWNQQFVASTNEGRRYTETADEVERAVAALGTFGMRLDADTTSTGSNLFTSHEALLLDFEQALTRSDNPSGDFYDCSAHMVWIGDRTRRLGGAHVEFARGISNPIGVKVGPTTTANELVELCDVLNPGRVAGRLSLICRLGVGNVQSLLPELIGAVERADQPVVWQCDPMHGNTFVSEGRKTRHFEDILGEIRGFFAVHRDLGTWPGGLHVELTGDDVTECLGGIEDILEEQLALRYTTTCDPRLNARQALDLAYRVAELLRD